MSDDGRTISETAVRFERTLPGPITRVWAYLTDSKTLGWLGGGTITPAAGGAVNLMNGHIKGVVTQWQPPHRLSFTWNVFSPGETQSQFPESYLTFELKEEGDNVRLTLTHRPMLEGFDAQTKMGWHTMLDLLEAELRGEKSEPREVVMERNRIRYGVTKIKMTRD